MRGVVCQRQRLGPKLEGGWARGASKKVGTPYLFLQPLKLATSNLVHNLGLGLAYQKQLLGQKLAGSGPREHPNKIWDTLRISATVEANNFKCGTQIGFGTSLAKKQHLRPTFEGVWAMGTSKKIGTPYLFLQPLKLATSNLVCNLGFGLAYQKTTFETKIGGGLGQGSIRKKLGLLFISATDWIIGTQQVYLARHNF